MRHRVEFTRTQRTSIARIWSAVNGQHIGSGFVVNKRHGIIVTCAHVVAQAMGDRDLCYQPRRALPGSELELDFPMIAQQEKYSSRLIGWSRRIDAEAFTASDGDNNDLSRSDIAILKIVGKEGTFNKIQHVTFSFENDSVGGEMCLAMGWPEDVSRGNSISCSVGGPVVGGTQLLSEDNRNEFIEGGFSGGPIWSEKRGLLIGMTHSIHGTLDRTSYFIGSAHIRAVLDANEELRKLNASYRIEHETIHEHMLINREDELKAVETHLKNASRPGPGMILISDWMPQKPDYLGNRIAKQTIRKTQSNRPEYCLGFVPIDLDAKHEDVQTAFHQVKTAVQNAVIADTTETKDIVTKLNERGKPCIYLSKLTSVPTDLALIKKWVEFWESAYDDGLEPLVFLVLCFVFNKNTENTNLEPVSKMIEKLTEGNSIVISDLGMIIRKHADDWVEYLRSQDRIDADTATELCFDFDDIFEEQTQIELHDFIRKSRSTLQRARMLRG